MAFTATVAATGTNTTGIRVPDAVVEALGQGRRPRVVVTIDDGYTFRTTLGTIDGAAFISVSAAVREEAGVAAGDVVEVELTVDTEPRTVEVPDDLAAALAGDPDAASWFASLTDSQRNGFVTSVTGAKQPETRRRRVARAVEALAAHEKRP